MGSCQNKVTTVVRKWLMLILTLLGIISGFGLGFLVRLAKPSASGLMWLGLPGEVFLNLLKMPIIPLIVCSVITASASMDPKKNGKLGVIFLLLNVGSNFLGAGIGIILAVLIKPGSGIDDDTETTQTLTQMDPEDIAADLIRNIFPNNIVRATLQKAMTKYQYSDRTVTQNISGVINTTVIQDFTKAVIYTDATNVIGLLFCCTVFGLAAGQAKERGKPMLAFFQSMNDVVMIVLQWCLWFAPIGILSLIAASIASIADISTMMIKLSLLVAAVLSGLALHQLILVPALYFALTRKNPFVVHFVNFKAWFLSFASASSAGAMPYLYEACAKLHIDEHVTSFGVPFAVTLNATGSSLFICCAVIFLAQINQVMLNIGQLLLLFLITSASTLALPSAPSASIVLVVILCSTFGIPAESLGLLFAVEWFLDRIRTTSNVVSEIFIIVTTWHFMKKDFSAEDPVKISNKNSEDIECGHNAAIHSSSTLL